MLNFRINNKNRSLLILLLPVIITFFITLIPTLKYQWPLSWDVFYHVHMAKLYMENGITFFDPLTFAPYGRPTFYTPLFHYLIALFSLSFKIEPFFVARFLQPVFASSIVFSVVYVVYKIYDIYTGFFTGFFLMFSINFFRFMLPIPESMALIFFPLVIYGYYSALENDKYQMSIIAGLLGGIILLTHSLTAICLVLVLTVYTLILKIQKRKDNLKHFWILLIFMLLLASLWWIPIISIYGYVFNNPPGNKIPLLAYMKFYGIITIVFAIFGGFLMFKRRFSNDLLILSGTFSLIFFSQIYWLGIPILSDRILTFSVFFVSVLAANGLKNFRIKNHENFNHIIAPFIIILAIFSSVYGAQKLEPSSDLHEIDIANWFKFNGNKHKVVITSNYELSPVIVSIARQPVSEGGYGPGVIHFIHKKKYVFGDFSCYDALKDNIGYLVLENYRPTPTDTIVVYSNEKYKICKIKLNKI